ncbi:MAG: hypothetical protein AVDCRST_MAG03-3813, partial [uncultured Rubrobacteraceae bacterium]
ARTDPAIGPGNLCGGLRVRGGARTRRQAASTRRRV